MSANLGNSAVATGLGKVSFHSNTKKGQWRPKKVQTTTQLHSFHMLPRSSSKPSKVGFNRMWTETLQMKQLDSEKAAKREIKLLIIVGSQKEQESSRKKKSACASLTMLKLLTVWITTNCGKFLKRWEYQTTLPASWETCMQVKKQQLEPNMEQQTGSKLRKE